MSEVKDIFNLRSSRILKTFLAASLEGFVPDKDYAVAYAKPYCNKDGFGVSFNLDSDCEKTPDLGFFTNISKLSGILSKSLTSVGVFEQAKEQSNPFGLITSCCLCGNSKDGFRYHVPFSRLREDVNSIAKAANHINKKSLEM